MTRLTILSIFLLLFIASQAQNNKPLIDSLKQNLNQAKTDKDKLFWMSELVIWLSEFDSTGAKSYADQQMNLAEASRDRRFIMNAIFSEIRVLNLKFNASQSRIDKAIDLSKKALDIAKESNDEEYQALVYTQLSDCYFQRENNKALEYANTAADIASTIKNDSIAVTAFIMLGDNYMVNGNKIVCFRNYLKAYDIGENSDNPTLKIYVNYRLSGFYGSIKQLEKQKDYLLKALNLARTYNLRYWQCWSLHSLGQVYAGQDNFSIAEEYYTKALNLADSLQYDSYKPNIYLSLTYNYKAKKDYVGYLKLLKDHPEIEESFAFASGNEGLDKLYRKAVVFKETERFDSAVYYYRQIEKMLGQYDVNASYKRLIYLDFGGSLIQLGNFKEALTAYKNAELYSDRSNPVSEQSMARWFDTIYHRLGDYQSAYIYKVKYETLQDSFDIQSKEDQLLMKEIDNETQRNEKIKAAEEESTRRRHNIQYLGITVSIIVVFTVLIMMGFFSLSVNSIQALGFFAFLLLFEFIILLADNLIHSLTHGEPWKVLIIKIGIAAILLPLHHYAEEKAIHYFATRKKLKMSGKKLFQNMIRSKQKPIKLDE